MVSTPNGGPNQPGPRQPAHPDEKHLLRKLELSLSMLTGLGEIRRARAMSYTADGRAELRNAGQLRDQRHYDSFDATPQEVYEHALSKITPERLEVFDAMLSEHLPEKPRVRPRAELAPGWLNGDEPFLSDIPLRGFVVPIISGACLPVGVDVITPTGRPDGYCPPTGLIPRAGEMPNPVHTATDLQCPYIPGSVLVVASPAAMIWSLFMRPSDPVISRVPTENSDAADLAEMLMLRPTIVGSPYAPPGRVDAKTMRVSSEMHEMGVPPLPTRPWTGIFGNGRYRRPKCESAPPFAVDLPDGYIPSDDGRNTDPAGGTAADNQERPE